jgi:hypothetical protein
MAHAGQSITGRRPGIRHFPCIINKPEANFYMDMKYETAQRTEWNVSILGLLPSLAGLVVVTDVCMCNAKSKSLA